MVGASKPLPKFGYLSWSMESSKYVKNLRAPNIAPIGAISLGSSFGYYRDSYEISPKHMRLSAMIFFYCNQKQYARALISSSMPRLLKKVAKCNGSMVLVCIARFSAVKMNLTISCLNKSSATVYEDSVAFSWINMGLIAMFKLHLAESKRASHFSGPDRSTSLSNHA